MKIATAPVALLVRVVGDHPRVLPHACANIAKPIRKFFDSVVAVAIEIPPTTKPLWILLPAATDLHESLLLLLLYPVILATALALGHDPDAPATLSKVTQTT